MTLGLANMRQLMTSLGNPEKRFESILIAGTNGKGSVSAFLSSILEANGKRVGWYTSPHIYSVRERICVAGEPVPLDVMEEAASRIVPLHKTIHYSYFEALTAIAFQVFAERGVEWAVLEVGLGGRFDATNVVQPRVSILTGISLDHRRILGDTEEEILREKLGITRPGVPFVCGKLSPDLQSLVETKASREHIPLDGFDSLGTVELGRMSFEGMRARLETRTTGYGEITLPFIGEHQMGNALVAVRAAELVLGRVERLAEAAEAVSLPGRFEVAEIRGKTVVLDVAHNDEALTATLKTLTALSPREENGIILGVMRRKELRDFPREIPGRVRRAYLIEPVEQEAFTSPELLDVLGMKTVRGAGLDVCIERFYAREDEWAGFIGRILSPANPCRVLLVTGSHRTVEVIGRQLRVMGLY
jgi:dihydrofolate synthase/folylpolyglutamate synthase